MAAAFTVRRSECGAGVPSFSGGWHPIHRAVIFSATALPRGCLPPAAVVQADLVSGARPEKR
jgi:hypothetical protein